MAEHNRTRAVELDRTGLDNLESASVAETYGPLWTASPLLVILGLLCLQSALFLTFAVGRFDMSVYVSLHVGLCAATAMFGLWWVGISTADDAKDKIALILLLATWTALAGPFGTLIAAALVVPRSATASHSASLAADNVSTGQGSELTRLELLHGSLLDRRLRLEHAHPIRALLDVIIDGTQIEKLDALSLISKRYAPALALALRRALEDKDGSVRVLAATVMAQQHNAHTKRIGALQTIARAAPESSHNWSELGQAHLDYAACGLLETSRAETETTQALTHLARARQLEPGDAATQARLNAIGGIAASLGQPTAAGQELPNDHVCRVTPHGA